MWCDLVAEFVFVDDFFWDVADLDFDKLWTRERGVEVKVLDVGCHELKFLVDMTLLNRILATSISAVGVDTAPG